MWTPHSLEVLTCNARRTDRRRSAPPRPPRSLRQTLPPFLRQTFCANARRYYRLAGSDDALNPSIHAGFWRSFPSSGPPSDLSDGLKTGAFDASLPLAQDSLTEPHSGAFPFRWTANKVMIQSCQALIS